MRRRISLLVLVLSACSAPGGPYPSLQPRAAEAIDPRVPVVKPMNARPVTPTLARRLFALVAQAQDGTAFFDAAAATAERLAASAGGPRSESWIAAQEALTAAIAASRPTATALADIDQIGANALQTQGGMSPNDLAAVRRAADQVGSIDRRQSERIDAIQRRLGT